jgi:peptidoglycan/xylan/chitin deacetylase (PgdA/CDA1 family)
LQDDVMSIAARLRNRLALFDRRRAAPLRLQSTVASFTFDDFPRSAYETGGRMIEAAGARATYFVVGSYMGRTVDGIEQYNEGTLRAAHAAGHEIGCHTFAHERLGEKGAGFAHETCDRNAVFVRDMLGADVAMTSFAYPYGDASLSVKNAMAARFSLCRGIGHALNTGSVDLAQLRIISLESRFINEVDIPKTVADAAAHKSWIIFMSHDVSENPSPFGSTPAMIGAALDALDAANIPVKTLREALA